MMATPSRQPRAKPKDGTKSAIEEAEAYGLRGLLQQLAQEAAEHHDDDGDQEEGNDLRGRPGQYRKQMRAQQGVGSNWQEECRR